MGAMPRKSFHVSLLPETYDALREEAAARGIPATRIVKKAGEAWIDDQKAERLRKEIAAYALEMAGTDADLNPALDLP